MWYHACLGKTIEYESMILLHMMQEGVCNFFMTLFNNTVLSKGKDT